MVKLEEEKINQFINLLDGLTAAQFSLLKQTAASFYSGQQSKVTLTNEDLEQIKTNCKRDFTY